MILRFLTAACLLILGRASASAQELPNPGFEQDLGEWVVGRDHGMSEASEAAARTGSMGLRVTDASTTKGSGLNSLPVEAEPGMKYEVSCWFRGVSGSGTIGIHILFLNEQLRSISRYKPLVLSASETEWKRHTLTAIAPRDTVAVQLWIHSGSKDTGVFDIDDIALTAQPAQ